MDFLTLVLMVPVACEDAQVVLRLLAELCENNYPYSMFSWVVEGWTVV